MIFALIDFCAKYFESSSEVEVIVVVEAILPLAMIYHYRMVCADLMALSMAGSNRGTSGA
jgi:hypothetical protein